MSKRNTLGFGLGLRSEYYQQILEQRPAVDWFGVISENYMMDGGKALYFLEMLKEPPLVMHGVSLSISPLAQGPLQNWSTSTNVCSA